MSDAASRRFAAFCRSLAPLDARAAGIVIKITTAIVNDGARPIAASARKNS